MWICPLQTSTFSQINARQQQLSNTEDEGVDLIVKISSEGVWQTSLRKFPIDVA